MQTSKFFKLVIANQNMYEIMEILGNNQTVLQTPLLKSKLLRMHAIVLSKLSLPQMWYWILHRTFSLKVQWLRCLKAKGNAFIRYSRTCHVKTLLSTAITILYCRNKSYLFLLFSTIFLLYSIFTNFYICGGIFNCISQSTFRSYSVP